MREADHAYKALNVEAVEIMGQNNTIDAMKFDDLIERFVGEERDFVLDNGATNFLPFMSYLVSNNVASVLTEAGRSLVLHVPIIGGEALDETMPGFNDIADSFDKDAEIVVWLNEAVNGPISFDGREFEASKAYERHRGKLLALVRVPHHTSMSATTIDIKTIIDAVTKRHNIRFASDDPILATVTVTEHIHNLCAEHLARLVEGVANQATDRLAAQIETGRREVAEQSEASETAAAKLINDAGAWSAASLKQASAGTADDIKATVAASLATVQADIGAARKPTGRPPLQKT